jgi:hypothetical protein
VTNHKPQNVGYGVCSSCKAEAHTSIGKPHRKCTKGKRGTWERPPEKVKVVEAA